MYRGAEYKLASTLGLQDGRLDSRQLLLKRGCPSRANALCIDFLCKSGPVVHKGSGGRAKVTVGVCRVLEVLARP